MKDLAFAVYRCGHLCTWICPQPGGTKMAKPGHLCCRCFAVTPPLEKVGLHSSCLSVKTQASVYLIGLLRNTPIPALRQ